MTDNKPMVATAALGVAALTFVAGMAMSPAAPPSTQLYTATGIQTKPVMTAMPSVVRTPNNGRLMNMAEPVEPVAPSQLDQMIDTQTAEAPVGPEVAPESNGPAIFNLVSTAFFASLFYMRRKTEKAKEYLGLGEASNVSMAASSSTALEAGGEGETKKGFGVDISLILCLAFWYLGNYYYNICNKYALTATGGAAGAPLIVANLQLGVGVIYGLFLWAAPDARKFPEISWDDVIKMIPLAIAFAGAHYATVFAMSAGAVSFGQIVKASEPAFAALLGTFVYKKTISKAKWLSLIPVIGGVCIASAAELSFTWAALGAGVLANLFAAVKANENKKAMDTPGLKDRLGTVGNQFAVTMGLSWLLSLPLVLAKEWNQIPGLIAAWQTNPIVSFNIIAAGLWFYLYNELATIVIKKTNAVTGSVANTAKRVIVIVLCGIVLGESLGTLKLIGCSIGIAGVFLYSIIDDLVKPKPTKSG